MTSEPLIFVPCTIHTPSGKDIAGMEAVGTGLSYSRSSTQPGFDMSYAIVHSATGSLLCPIEAHNEQDIQDAICEIIAGNFTNWRLPSQIINTQVTREQYDSILAIIRKHEHASGDEVEVEEISFEINFTVIGRMRVRTTNRHQAERIVTQVLEEFDVDNPEVEDYFIISADIN